ncbi:MAG: conjugal transfer protein TrbE, partial [Nitrosomonas sp.]
MIAAIAILIAICGAILLLILFIRIRDTEKEQKLDRHRSREMGFADLLVYAAVAEEGVIVGKNGSLMAAWIFRGEDTASSTDAEREHVSHRINQALSRLGNGWMIHVDAIRKPAQGYSDKATSNYPDPVTAAIDAERREVFEKIGTLYESCFIVTLTYLP